VGYTIPTRRLLNFSISTLCTELTTSIQRGFYQLPLSHHQESDPDGNGKNTQTKSMRIEEPQ
jgi:hypothetical protein